MAYSKTILKWSIILFFIIAVALLYKIYNPSENSFFPKCPFLEVTGLKCPGCGSQRAFHYLLNLEPGNAFQQNALAVIAMPYIVLGFAFDIKKSNSEKYLKWRKFLFGKNAIIVILCVIILFWILRNMLNF